MSNGTPSDVGISSRRGTFPVEMLQSHYNGDADVTSHLANCHENICGKR
jgi:hypothetical protein